MLKYIQKTGELFQQVDGVWVLIGVGYSGRDNGLNNHDMETIVGIGPIPCALWSISNPYDDPHLGPMAFRLVPLTYTGPRDEMSFRLHADNAAMNHTASEGCIVLSHEIRQKLTEIKPKYMIVEAE